MNECNGTHKWGSRLPLGKKKKKRKKLLLGGLASGAVTAYPGYAWRRVKEAHACIDPVCCHSCISELTDSPTTMDKDQRPIDSTPLLPPEATLATPELTASGKPKKRFVGKARKQKAVAEGLDSTTIEDSAIAIRDGNVNALKEENVRQTSNEIVTLFSSQKCIKVRALTSAPGLFLYHCAASKSSTSTRSRIANQVPDEILNDAKLNLAIEQLPSNYSFEIHKTVWSVRKADAKKGTS